MIAQHAEAPAMLAHAGSAKVREIASCEKAATKAIAGPYTAPNSHGSRACDGVLQLAHQYTGSHAEPWCLPSRTCSAKSVAPPHRGHLNVKVCHFESFTAASPVRAPP
jgi:hypothetical protein